MLFLYQVPVYWMAQYLGAFLAAAVVYGNYYNAMVHYSSDSSAISSDAYTIFASYPNGQYNPSNATLALDQVNIFFSVKKRWMCVCVCVCACVRVCVKERERACTISKKELSLHEHKQF